MMGEAESPGVVPRMASELFFCVDKALEASPDTKFLLTCSYLEIYNEVLHDLLQPPPKKGEPRQVLEVGEHPTLGVHVKGLLERPVRCETDVLSLLAAGSHRRAAAPTCAPRVHGTCTARALRTVHVHVHCMHTLHMHGAGVPPRRR